MSNKKYNTICVLGTQWGDESKGAVTDYYATNWANMVVRAQGGNNAGHTITYNGEKYAVRSLPSGIFTPNVVNVIAQGCVINPLQLVEEINKLKNRGIKITKDNLIISDKCHLIMDYHVMLDAVIEETRINPVKTTGNGIGPCYADKMYRLGIRLGDLKYGFDYVLELVQDAVTGHSLCVPEEYADDVTKEVLEAYKTLKEYVGNTARIIEQTIVKGENVLFEGAQAAMLDIDSSFYPYVTSSNPTVAGIAVGCGIAPKYFNDAIGVVKAYSTRVGSGPFITEIEDKELASKIRETGHEYGTVTGRPRRIGWLDLNVLREAVRINGFSSFAVRLVDVLTGIDKIYVSTGYKNKETGEEIADLPSNNQEFSNYDPDYVVLDGWKADISKCRTWEELPKNAQKYIKFIEREIGVPVVMIGVGPDREQTIMR